MGFGDVRWYKTGRSRLPRQRAPQKCENIVAGCNRPCTVDYLTKHVVDNRFLVVLLLPYQVALFDGCNDLNCNPTCLTGVSPGGRDQSDSALVWAIVLAVFAVAMLIVGACEDDGVEPPSSDCDLSCDLEKRTAAIKHTTMRAQNTCWLRTTA